MKPRKFLTALFLACALTQVALAGDGLVSTKLITPSRIELSVRSDGLKVTTEAVNGRAFDKFLLENEGIVTGTNGGELPVITRYVAIPKGATLRAEATVTAIRTLNTGRSLMAASLDPTTDKAQLSVGSAPQNDEIVSVGRIQTLRGFYLAPITVRVVKEEGAAGNYSIYDKVDVHLEIIPGRGQSNYIKSCVAGSNLDRLLESAGVLNVRRDTPQRFGPQGRYLALVREECLPFAIPMLEWKRQAGYDVEIMSYTGDELAVADVEFAIRERIKDIYEADLNEGREPYDYIWIIGDRVGNPVGPWVFPAFTDIAAGNTPPHADWAYGLMDQDENDILMDIGVARFAAGSEDQMELAVNRQLAYEKYPFMGQTAWFERAGIFTEHWGDEFTSDINLNVRWSEQLVRRDFDNIRYVEDSDPESTDSTLAEMFLEGRSLLIGRAQIIDWWRENPNLPDNNVFPYCINFCGHGEFAAHNLFADGTGDHVKGPVVWTTGWGDPETKFSNSIWNTLVLGVLTYDMPIGWARIGVGLRIPQIIPDRYESYRRYQSDLDVFGDPALRPWTSVPEIINIQHAPVRVGMDLLGVRLTKAADGTPVQSAQLTLYQPGDLPDPAEYADWEPTLMISAACDDSGRVRFVIPGGLNPGLLYITATGDNILPIWDSLIVADANTPVLSINNIEFQNQGAPVAGSTVDLMLTAVNAGGAAQNVTAVVSSSSPLIEVLAGQTTFGNLNHGGVHTGDRAIQLRISPSCPNGSHPPVTVTFTFNAGTSTGALDLDILAPKLSAESILEPSPLETDIDINPTVTNTGRRATAAGNVRLVSFDWRVAVSDSLAAYPSIAVGGHSGPNDGNFFRVRSILGLIPGDMAPLGLVFQSNEGIVDTVAFAMAFGTAAGNTPDGPDAYGYICLDASDTIGWNGPTWSRTLASISPYDPTCVVPGDTLPMNISADGANVLVNLPMPFKFYGNEYNQITVSSNGYIAVGDQRRQLNYQNTPLDLPAGGASGMIAPFWDHLTLTNAQARHGGVYVLYDSTAGTFTVEWYNIRFYIDKGAELQFQTVLYDSRMAHTISGDSPIRFNYRRIRHEEGREGEDQEPNDIAYASVGISSPDGKTGLCVNYDSSGTAATPLVTNNSSLLFVTAPRAGKPSNLSITIVDSTTGRIMPDVQTTLGGYALKPLVTGVSNANGQFEMKSIPPGYYDVVLSKHGYSRVPTSVNITEGSSEQIRIALTHPAIWCTSPLIDSLQPGLSMYTTLRLYNRGNGPLTFIDTVFGGPVVQIGDYNKGVVPAGGSIDLSFFLMTFGVAEGVYEHTVLIRDPLAEIDTTFTWRVVVDHNTSVRGEPQPIEWGLSEAYPNPFNSSTRFEISVAKAGKVKLMLFDNTGRMVETIQNGRMPVGIHPIVIDAAGLPPGIYFARLEGEGFTATRKMVLMK